MEKIMGALDELKSMNTAYGIDTDGISKLQKEMSTARVCTPIIGKFSSGKSALVNTILGYSRKILKEDMEAMGPVRLRDVEEAQQYIVTAAKELSNNGEIVISEGKDSDELIY